MDAIEIGVERADLLSAAWPTSAIVLLAIVAGAAWLASHLVARRWLAGGDWWVALPGFFIRTTLGFVTLWFICSALNRVILLDSSWSIWLLCLVTAASVEAIISLYRLERMIVSRTAGLTLVALRGTLVLLVALMLIQPVLSWTLSRTHERFIAVLLDDSASMQIVDRQLTDSEKLQLADVLLPGVADRPYQLDAAVAELSPWIERLGSEAESLSALKAADRSLSEQRFSLQRDPLRKQIESLREKIAKHSGRLDDLLVGTTLTLKKETRETAQQLREQLNREVTGRLLESEKLLADNEPDFSRAIQMLSDHLGGAASALRDIVGHWPQLADQVDRAFLASLPPERKEKLDTVAQRTRLNIARALLLGEDEQDDGLIKNISDGYSVRIFRFAGESAELDVDSWTVEDELAQAAAAPADGSSDPDAKTDDQPKSDNGNADAAVDEPDPEPSEPASAPAADRLKTDLAGGLAKIRDTIAAENLAGVVVLSDGRHNADGDAEAMAAQLAAQKAPVSVIALGSSRPPVDAAILDVEYPKSLFVEDKFNVKTHIKLTGMRGREVRLKLASGDGTLAEQILPVPSDEFMTIVELSHAPSEEGLQQYSLALEPIDADKVEAYAFEDNVQRDVTVAVSDERTQMLVIEGRPRWEFRYLRNLLASRDKTVQLQTVLFSPDRVRNSTELPQIHASVARPDGDVEATLPPASESEWLKFDVIVLGDVPPESLDAKQLEAIEKFVVNRGGTLIVIAGPHYMPHRFADTLLAELLPVNITPEAGSIMRGPEPNFRWGLTEVGRRHAVLQQADSAEANSEFWNSVPELYWRHPIVDTKPGATVLAYATNRTVAAELAPKPGQPDEEAEALRQRREAYERQNALLAVQPVGAGRVMMLNTDRTWRLRYRTGDIHHHRFWGQVLRWAESDKLQAGTQHVRLGTDRILYEHDQPVTVRAQITDSYHAPVKDEEAVIKIFRDQQLLISQRLNFVADSPGRYELTLGKLPGAGQYRLELDSPEAKKVLAGEGADTVSAMITVLPPEAATRELIETTTDRAALTRIAHAGGGTLAEAGFVSSVVEFFAPGTENFTEVKRFRLWDSWPLLVLMLLVLTAEWVLRKKVGLT